MKLITFLFTALLCILTSANAQSQQVIRVLEFCPAPGQFTNTLPDIDATMSKAERLQACEQQLQDGNLISLGAAGGYITLALDQPIKNGKGSDLRILGNAMYAINDPVYGDATIGGSIEPGIVYAGVGSSPETAKWYELAGSEYYTTQRHNFSITYHKPTAEMGEHNIPYFGICLGMQIATIEFARNVLGYKDANSSEFDKNSTHKVIDFIHGQSDEIDKGGTMRLGAYPCHLQKDTKLSKLYGVSDISERHRHRYEFNNEYLEAYKKAGMTIAGINPDAHLVEAVENDSCDFFVGVQFHPEFKSRPNKAHPVFRGFIAASLAKK